ncbi:carboxypeptidase A1-like protein [Phlyctochytrium arcticum]|nr:carboxypeptidase A1-like protein [Phlyctochytrium arcticum]
MVNFRVAGLLVSLLSASAVSANLAPRRPLDAPLESRALQFAADLDSAPYHGQKVVRLSVPESATQEVQEFLHRRLNLDVWDTQASHIDVRIPAGADDVLQHRALRDIAGSDIHAKVIVEDVEELIRRSEAPANESSIAAADWFANYHKYDEIKQWYTDLSKEFPDLVTFIPSVGKTTEGRDIFATRITSKKNASSNKPQLYWQGLQHAREWIGGATVQYLSDQLIRGYAQDPTILDSAEFIIVPVVNPDGYEFSQKTRLWRKNRRNNGDGTYGVDLNRNWNDHWGQGGSSSSTRADDYKGPSVASEPEVKVLSKFFLAPENKNIVGAIDFHSYSQLVLRPPGWTATPTKDEAILKKIGDAMRDTIKSVHGVAYRSISAYSLYKTTGSVQDWWYGEEVTKAHGGRRVSAFTIELRPGENSAGVGFVLPPSQIKPTGEEIWAAAKVWINRTLANPLA